MSTMETRDAIMEHIRRKPGITFRQLARELGLGIGTVQYHLHRLEREGKVVSFRANRKRYLFPNDFNENYEALMTAISNSTQRRILLLIAEEERTLSDIASALGLTPATISYHMKRLEKLGLVERRPCGKYVAFRPAFDVDTLLRLLKEYRPKIWDELADRLVDLVLNLKGEGE